MAVTDRLDWPTDKHVARDERIREQLSHPRQHHESNSDYIERKLGLSDGRSDD